MWVFCVHMLLPAPITAAGFVCVFLLLCRLWTFTHDVHDRHLDTRSHFRSHAPPPPPVRVACRRTTSHTQQDRGGLSEVAARCFLFVCVSQQHIFVCVVCFVLCVGLCPVSGRVDAEGCAEVPPSHLATVCKFCLFLFVCLAGWEGFGVLCFPLCCASARALTGYQCLALLAISSTCLTLFSEFFSSFPHGTLYAIGLPLHI